MVSAEIEDRFSNSAFLAPGRCRSRKRRALLRMAGSLPTRTQASRSLGAGRTSGVPSRSPNVLTGAAKPAEPASLGGGFCLVDDLVGDQAGQRSILTPLV